MKVLIIEDEKRNVSWLQRILFEISPVIDIIGILSTVKESIAWSSDSQSEQPNVILMDIRLADGISFDIFDKIEVDYPIIFTTSYDEYAIRAFKVNSIDYLLKPIQKEELECALNKVERYPSKFNSGVDELIRLIRLQNPIYRKRFLLPKTNGYQMVLVEDVDYIYSEMKITMLVCRDGGEKIIQQSLEELEEELDPKLFFRANRQFIININSILTIKNIDKGKLSITLKSNILNDIVVSREKAPFLKRWLDK